MTKNKNSESLDSSRQWRQLALFELPPTRDEGQLAQASKDHRCRNPKGQARISTLLPSTG